MWGCVATGKLCAVHGSAGNARLRRLYLETDGVTGELRRRDRGGETGRGCHGCFSERPEETKLGLTTLQGSGVSLSGCGKGQDFSGRPVLPTETVPSDPGQRLGSRPLEALELQVTFRLGRWGSIRNRKTVRRVSAICVLSHSLSRC